MIDLSNNAHLFLMAVAVLLVLMIGVLTGAAPADANVLPCIAALVALIAVVGACIGLWGMLSQLL